MKPTAPDGRKLSREEVALRMSAAKYKMYAEIPDSEILDIEVSGRTCPLCSEFRNPARLEGCAKCPVSKDTGRGHCNGTPYSVWHNIKFPGSNGAERHTLCTLVLRFSPTAVEKKIAAKKVREICKEEHSYLQGLAERYAAGKRKGTPFK